jgi:hypothetical protein
MTLILSARIQRGNAPPEDGQLIEIENAGETAEKAVDLSVNLS